MVLKHILTENFQKALHQQKLKNITNENTAENILKQLGPTSTDTATSSLKIALLNLDKEAKDKLERKKCGNKNVWY